VRFYGGYVRLFEIPASDGVCILGSHWSVGRDLSDYGDASAASGYRMRDSEWYETLIYGVGVCDDT